MHILQVASEMAPFAKVGGLADVITGLSRELIHQGHSVIAIIPKYGVIDFSTLTSTGRCDSFYSYYDGKWHSTSIEYFVLDECINVGLLDTEQSIWKSQPSVYTTTQEDTSRFLRFSRAIADWLKAGYFQSVEVIHVHDWQTCSLTVHFQNVLQNSYVLSPSWFHTKPKFVLTLHNLEYQGICSSHELEKAGIDIHEINFEKYAQDIHEPFYINILQVGIQTADVITTVSSTYAIEAVTKEGGKGLDAILKMRKASFFGILNGIDYSYWSPDTDAYIHKKFRLETGIQTVFMSKEENKRQLFSLLGIHTPMLEKGKTDRIPLVATVTRLVEQKGLHLIEDVVLRAKELQIQCVILGTSFDTNTFLRFQKLDKELRYNGLGAVIQESSEKLAHLIFASSDIFLVPSLFEPCGLTQMIALKYGAVPVVRRTGGLADTVVDVDYPKPSEYVSISNGYSFDHPDITGIYSALYRAICCYKNDVRRWHEIVQQGMALDFSWHKPARQYVEIYKKAD